MSANYWDSTQHQFWTFTRAELAAARARLEGENMDLIQMFPLPGPRDLSIYFNSQINRLAKRLGARQQAVCTAQVYVKRFYIRVEIRRTNPYLVMATSLYLACKIEECPQHIRLVVGEARALWQDLAALDISRVGECEFFLISEMSSRLIIHHPYRTLSALQSDLGLSTEDMNLAWSVISDSWMTDLPLLFPPHVVAAGAILLALAPRQTGGGGTGGAAAVAAAVVAAAVGAAAAPGSSFSSAPPGPESPATAANPAATAFLPHVQQSRGGSTTGARDEPHKQQQQHQSQQHQQRLQQHQYQSQHQHLQQQQQQSQHQHQPQLQSQQPQQQQSQQQSQQEAAKERERSQQELGFAKAHRFSAWLAESGVNLEDVVNCTQEIISFYECMEQHRDKLTREQINRFVKARGLDK